MKIFAMTSIAMLTLIGIGSASAASVDVPTLVVRYGDLDLTHADGAAALYRRLNQAARHVCSSLDPSQSAAPLLMVQPYKLCMGKAVADAVVKIDKPEFTAYVANQAAVPSIKLASR